MLHWFSSGLGTILLGFLLYTPILIFTGTKDFFSNQMVSPVPWSALAETIIQRIVDTWSEWNSETPTLIAVFLISGWVLSLFFHGKLSTIRIPLQLAAFLWVTILILIQRPNTWPRVWFFLLPIMIVWACAGIVGLFAKIHLNFIKKLPAASILIGLALVAETLHAAWLAPQISSMSHGRGSDEEAVLFVKSELTENDLIIVAFPDDAAVWYYSDLHGIPESYYLPGSNYDRALVIVNTSLGQTPEQVIVKRGPDDEILDEVSAHVIGTFANLQVFEVPCEGEIR